MAHPRSLAFLASLASLTTLALACASEFRLDPAAYCRDEPANADCQGVTGAGGAGGRGGEGGTGEGGGGAGGQGEGGGGSGGGGLDCAAPTTNCAGTCVNVTADDANNCGACGRSCLGKATCAGGACVPEPMTSGGEVAPYALVQDDLHLYWVTPAVRAGGSVNDLRVRRVPKASAGGAAESLFGTARARARSLGFDGTRLYWGELGASPSDNDQNLFSSVPGDVTTQLVEAAQLGVQHIALGADKVYWLLAGGSGAVRGREVGGAAGTFDPSVADQTNPSWLALDGDRPYWVANAGGQQREVRRLRAGTSNAFDAVASGPNVVSVEVTADRIYWAERAGTVRFVAKGAPPPATSAEAFADHGPVEGFRVEGTTLYVVTAQGRTLGVWRKVGEADALLLGRVEAQDAAYAGNPFGAAYVLTDTNYVYFADVGTLSGFDGAGVQISNGDGVIYRVAK